VKGYNVKVRDKCYSNHTIEKLSRSKLRACRSIQRRGVNTKDVLYSTLSKVSGRGTRSDVRERKNGCKKIEVDFLYAKYGPAAMLAFSQFRSLLVL
jgi:hypothetical protein